MMVWQARERNEWVLAIERALEQDGAGSAEPFSLADPGHTEPILRMAGFSEVTFDEVHEAVCYGMDGESAFACVSQFALVQAALRDRSSGERERLLDRLRGLLTAHQTQDGVCFGSRAWIVAARC